MPLTRPPETGDPPTDAADRPAGDVLHAAEELVERAVIAAERSLVARVGQHGLRMMLAALRIAAVLAIGAYFVFGSALLLTRYYLLPHIGDWRPDIEAMASKALHAPVTIGHIEGDWQGLRPRLLLSDVTLLDANSRTALALPQVDVVVAWTTLVALQPRMRTLTVRAPELEIRRLADHRWAIAGIVIDPQAQNSDTSFIEWVLAQHRISVRDARVHFVDELAPAPETAANTGGPPGAIAAAPPGEAQPGGAAAAPMTLDFADVNFDLVRGLTAHQFALQLRPPAQLAGPIDLRGEFRHPWSESTARMSAWSGQVFAQLDYTDLARMDALTHLVPAPAHIEKASGAVRAWIDFTDLQVTRVRADVALTNVTAQLGATLQPLRLDILQGRITNTIVNDGDSQMREIALNDLRLDGPDGVHLPPTDLLFRTTRNLALGTAPASEQSQFEASRIQLGDWSKLAAQLPLPAEWLDLISRTAARGVLENVHATWDGGAAPVRNYALRTRFSGLGFTLDRPAAGNGPETATQSPVSLPDGEPAPPPALPYEFSNLAGSVDLTQESGSLQLAASDVHLQIPSVFDDGPLVLDTLTSRLRWSRRGDGALLLDVDSLAAGNADLDVSLSGSYRRGGAEPERLDVNGRIGHARMAAVANYVPKTVAATARNWLHGALRDGLVTDGAFFLHGDPRRFPYASGNPNNDQFHLALHVRDGRLDVAPPKPQDPSQPVPEAVRRAHRWPELSEIEGDVVIDQNRLNVAVRHAKAYGYDLSGINARIAQLEQPDQHLLVDGQGSGPLAELLHYLGDSPVNVWTGGWLGSASAGGAARLQMRLDLPMAHAVDTIVGGSVSLRGNSLTLRPDIAPFSALTGQLEFHQRGIRMAGVTAGFLGGAVRLSADTQADGTVLVRAEGTATPQGAKRQFDLALLRRVLDRTRGTVGYSAMLAVRHGTIGLRVDSDMVGLAADLPEPFRKTAAEARPLHIETVPLAGAAPERDTLSVNLANQLALELHRVAGADGAMHIERGILSLGGSGSLPEHGLLLYVDQPRLDLDRWRKLLGGPAPGPGAPAPAEGAALGNAALAGSAQAPSEFDRIDFVAVRTGELLIEGKSLTNVALSAKREADQGWTADIDSDQAAGAVHWLGAQGSSPGRLIARLAKLALPEKARQGVTELLDTPPTEFPALDIVAEQFELGASKLGRLEVEAQNTGPGRGDTWDLQRLVLSNPDGKISASGLWQRDGVGAARKMTVKVNMSFGNAGGMLGRFGIPGTIKNGSGKLDGDLSWRGAPFSIDYPSLTGTLRLVTEKGQFLKADSGAVRLLGVLSLQSLAHRVTGDFRDVFSEGFAFDSLTASATIASGTLTTDDFIMKGVNAVVRIKGSADLHAETQNLEVVVLPEINAGTASLAYALVNPAIGLGTFIANILLRKQLSAAFTNIYEVSGPWSNPQVKRVKTEAAANPAPVVQ